MAAALLWRNLSVFEPSSGCHISAELKEEKRILKGINGAILYKSLNAIMGPSGAGKTTLLKCLFGTSSIKYTGSIFVGDRSTKAVFISQNEEDHLLLNLTVEESIRFACKVKNNSACRLMSCILNHGSGKTNGDKGHSSDSDLVSSLIDQLDLERCRHTLARKCSGGQKKRLAIAQELASKIKPKIIFMDEPTSGIDSSVSYLVLRQLQSLSQRNGIAILCTIHQPSYKILELFDQLYILSRRGRVMYDGKPQFLRPHLLRYSFPCPDGHNPADVVIELASTETRKDQVQLKPGCLGFCSTISIDSRDGILSETIHSHTPTQEIQKIETLEKVAEIECEEIVESLHVPQMVEVKKLCSSQSPKTIFHTWFLFKRSFINSVWREPRWLMIRFALHVLVAVILTLLYDGQVGLANGCLKLMKGGSPAGGEGGEAAPAQAMCRCPTSDDVLKELKADNLVGKNVAFLFFNLMFLMFAALMPTVLTFPAEMKVFLNEHRNGWYSTRSYYWAKNFVEFLVQLPLPYAYSLYIYWWTGQLGLSFESDSRFNQFVLITILSSFIAQGVGLMIGAIFTHNFNISIFVSTIFMMFNFLFSGFFIKIDQMENVEFLTKFSFTRFAFEAIIVAVYGDRCKSSPPAFHEALISSTTTTAAPIAMAYASPAIRTAANSWIPITSSPIISPSSTSSSSSLISSNSTNVISTIMYQFNVKEDIFNESILWLILHLIGWRVCTYVTLWWKANPDSFHKKFFFIYFALRKGCSIRKFLCTILSFLIFAMIAVAAFTFFLW